MHALGHKDGTLKQLLRDGLSWMSVLEFKFKMTTGASYCLQKNAHHLERKLSTSLHAHTNISVMSVTKPPSQETFLKEGSERDTCAICLLDFGPDHLPVRVTPREGCVHIFGKNCMPSFEQRQR
jgi:hypothetical protein